MLLVVLPFYSGDAIRMERLLTWIQSLDKKLNHRCLLHYEDGVDISRIKSLAGSIFDSVAENKYPIGRTNRWPESPNRAWSLACAYMISSGSELPWLWLESDATPLKSGWLDALEREYINGSKPFMGNVCAIPEREISAVSHGEERLAGHMNGVAIYPSDAGLHSSRAMRTRVAAWDVVLSEDCIGRVHEANHLIASILRFTGITLRCTDPKVISFIKSTDLVLLHGVNDGSLIDMLSGEEPPSSTDTIVKILSVNDFSNRFDECEAMWQRDASELAKSGFSAISFDECRIAKPSFRDQTAYRCGIFHQLEYGVNAFHINPSICRDDMGSTWLLSRRWERISRWPIAKWNSTLVASKIDVSDRMSVEPNSSVTLDFKSPPNIQREDPRVFSRGGEFLISYCEWETGLRVPRGRQGLAVASQDWNIKSIQYPAFGLNVSNTDPIVRPEADIERPIWEKNWTWFSKGEDTYCIYSFSPLRIFKLGKYLSEPCRAEPKVWRYGIVRGGTNPILHNGLYWTFFHSSLPWNRKQKRYYMGAYAFNDRFEIVRMTVDPILCGSERDNRLLGGPLVIFPGGALIENGEWIVVFGVNDEQSGWIKIPHCDLEKATIEC